MKSHHKGVKWDQTGIDSVDMYNHGPSLVASYQSALWQQVQPIDYTIQLWQEGRAPNEQSRTATTTVILSSFNAVQLVLISVLS